MIHRHLDYPADTPVDALGDAALDDMLDQGDLEIWQPLFLAIAADPYGRLAERVLLLCDANPRYGTSPLWRAWIAKRRAALDGYRAPHLTLSELRSRRGMSQTELASSIGMTQSDLSKVERRADWRLSTLTSIARGLGLHARIVFEDEHGQAVGIVAAVGGRRATRRRVPKAVQE